MRWARLGALAIAAAATATTACKSGSTGKPAPAVQAPASSASASARTHDAERTLYDPAHDLGPLFAAVQNASLFPDSKTFVDSRPLTDPKRIAAAYVDERGSPHFDLHAFVISHFELPAPQLLAKPASADTIRAAGDSLVTMDAHLRSLWPLLTRPADTPSARSSLIPLPHPYVVPGGRFREIYYWDSYFTMLGLVESRRVDLVKDMLDNFAFLVTTVGHVPNGNRTYYLGRSQPPYLAAMVGLYATATDTAQAMPYLEALEKEHDFWMDGASKLAPGTAWRRVVRLPNGVILNRYWDDIAEPRPESYREDVALAQTVDSSKRELLYRNLRAGAESGWDFSSRWMRDPKDLRTLEVTELAPIDLNSLLYHSERTIAAFRRYRKRGDDVAVALRYDSVAGARRTALLDNSYDRNTGWFYDIRWRTGERVSDRPTLAAAAPLYFGIATPGQGAVVADRLARDFLAPGGFTTTLVTTGQQWDAPNGWAPLEWLAIEGARCYQHATLANIARERWLTLNRRVFRETGKMTEKYDVMNPTRVAGGGEYPAQDGFGWTNGVALALAPAHLENAATPRGDFDRSAGAAGCWR
jgi:alpha,alpha-trehalase